MILRHQIALKEKSIEVVHLSGNEFSVAVRVR